MKGFDTMSIFEIIAGVALILCGLVIIALVCMQEPKSGLGTVAGGADMYASMQSRSTDAKIAQTTKYAGVAFFVLAIAVAAINLIG